MRLFQLEGEAVRYGQYQQDLNIKGGELELAHRNSQARAVCTSSLGYWLPLNNPGDRRVSFY